ncbi:MAG: DUF1440 domain-containing protein [Alphaproteobacteria bacterium]|nr:DUF1440 domain-containing protein [Alphaproteobacteria bacterium]
MTIVMNSPDATGNVGAGLLAGALAGLTAAWAMNAAQAAFPVKPAGNADPATVRAARKLNRFSTGKKLAQGRKRQAGTTVHYAFGAFLGALYGAATERYPRAAAGWGLPFGLAITAIADEAIVPALGLGPAPWATPGKTHAYGAASHMVFGAVAEAVRKIIRPLF